MKIRKRLNMIGVVLSIIFGFTLVYASPSNIALNSRTENLKVVNFAMYEFIQPINDLQSLEEKSDIIIKAKVLPEHESVLMLPFGYTRTKVQITKVYKGNVKVNDSILIGEEYFEMIDPKTGEKFIRAMNLYKPCIDGEEYIFFLNNSIRESAKELNMYEIFNVTAGRFPVLNEQDDANKGRISKSIKAKAKMKIVSDRDKIEKMSNEELNLNEGDITQYKKLFAEVSQKYS